MKISRTLPIFGAVLAFSSCSTLSKLKQPLSDDGYNPLDKPGSRRVATTRKGGVNAPMPVGLQDHGFKNGDIVEVAIANTALFKRVPQPGDRYIKVLKVGDVLKVIGGEKDFIRVVDEKGKSGYVSSVMVVSQGALTSGGAGLPLGPMEIAPEPEIPGIGKPEKIPTVPVAPVPDITKPVPLDPDPVIPTPNPVPTLPKPEPIPDPGPKLPAPEPSGPAPDPEVPGL